MHYLLLKVLEANNLKLSDIEAVYLPPSDARAAFERGAVDAWVIWDPFFAAAEHQISARVIATGENLVSNHQFYLADRKFAEAHPEVLKTVVNELNTTTQWVEQNQQQAAKLLEKPTGLSLDILQSFDWSYGLWRSTHFSRSRKKTAVRCGCFLSTKTHSEQAEY